MYLKKKKKGDFQTYEANVAVVHVKYNTLIIGGVFEVCCYTVFLGLVGLR